MPSLHIHLLGPFHVTVDGVPVTTFESDKVRALLALLVTEPDRPQRRETLAGMLWPGQPESSARMNLRHALFSLRRSIGDHQAAPRFLITSRQTVQFNRASNSWVDVWALLDLLESAQGSEDNLARLEKALDCYRGSYLQGFSLSDSPEFEEWALLTREQLQRLAVEALHRLASELENAGEYERALPHAYRQVELDPWRERAHQQLMRLLALSGRRSEALAQYYRCCRLLGEELGVTPSAETARLFELIRDENLAGTAPSPKRGVSPIHNLPLATGPFAGREAEIAEIQDCLLDPACRLLTLVGAGGMGKTRLALEAVRDWMSPLQEDGLEGATLVPLAPVQTAEAIAPTIAQAVGFPMSPGREPEQQLLETLHQKRWLLILDSFEHLLEGAGFVAEILRAAPHVKVLVTSRTRLNLHGEHCLPVAGIKFPEEIPGDAQQARGFAAVSLFLQAAHRVQPGFEPADADLAAISGICRQVQGMPLGILLAAAWSGVLRPAEIASEIQKDLDFLEADWPDAPRQQRSIRAVFDRSWNLLAERERSVFQALSVFSGGFTRAAAQHVSGASLPELRALADKSLLQYGASGRYEIHELLRQFAVEKLHASPGAAMDVSDRHSAYYMAALQRWEADLTGARQPVALIEMEVEVANISVAWAWAVEQRQVERLDRAMEGLEQFCWQSGRYRQAEAALQAAASAAATIAQEAVDKAASMRVWVRALAWQSNFQRAMGQTDAARRLQRQCLAILQDPALAGADTRLERAVLSWSRGVTVCMDDYALGKQRFAESYALFRELDHQWGMAWALNASGTMSLFLGNYGDAEQRLKEGLALHQALGHQAGVAGSLSRLAESVWQQGRLEEAERLAREGVATSLEAGNRTESAFALLNLGEVLEQVGKFSEAHSVLQQSLERYTDLEHRHYITNAHGLLGSVELHRGRYQEACDQARICLDLAQTHGPRFCVGLGHLILGCQDLAKGAPASAHQHLQDAIAVYRETESKSNLSLTLACLALSARERGNAPEARQHLHQALEIAQESEAVAPLWWVLLALALLLTDEGEHERAVELYALASRYPLVAKSRWFADVVGKQITAAASTLPAERVAILQERGRARDLEATVADILSEMRM